MQLVTIYEPIQKDLEGVEQTLRAIANVDNSFLGQLLNYILENGGKRIRPALTLLAGKFYDYDHSLLVPMAAAVELLHTATLVHDDTIDDSMMRRGKLTVNRLWGEARAVLFGDYLFAKAADLVASTGNMRAIKLFASTLMIISNGELRQTAATFDLRQTRGHYYQWIGAKTASLFSAAAESGATLSRSPEEAIGALRDYGYNLGMAFQIVDDILDFIGEEVEMGKPVGCDLNQGALTLPVICFLERYPDDDLVKRVFENEDAKSLKQVVERIRGSSLVEECFNVASDFCVKARQALTKFPDNPTRQSLLSLADYALQRKK